MGGSGRKTLMSLAGVYLAYVGGKLFLDAMREKPGNYIFMMIMGIIFVVFGVGTVVIYMRGAFKHEKIEEEQDTDDEADELPEDETANSGEQMERKPAAFVNLTESAVDEKESTESAGDGDMEAAAEEDAEEDAKSEENDKETENKSE